jgi:uncharacterized protein (DUF305 family)
MHHRKLGATSLFVAALVLLNGCGRSDSAAGDSAAATTATTPATADTGSGSMAGMDHSAMTTTPAKDADQEFVRMMVDHHQGLIVMSDTAVARNPSPPVQQEATTMKQKQSAEQKTMLDMLKSDYGEDKMAMVLPSNAAMIAEVASKSGSELDRTFRQKVIAHHEEALKMISDYEPRFTKPAVRTMAAKMKSDQQKEIAKLRSELGQT